MDSTREEFETDAKSYGYEITRAACPCCDYADLNTNHRWLGWQAATEQSQQRIAELEADRDELLDKNVTAFATVDKIEIHLATANEKLAAAQHNYETMRAGLADATNRNVELCEKLVEQQAINERLQKMTGSIVNPHEELTAIKAAEFQRGVDKVLEVFQFSAVDMDMELAREEGKQAGREEAEKEAMEQDAALIVYRNSTGQLRLSCPNGDTFDMSQHVGASFYAKPFPQQKPLSE